MPLKSTSSLFMASISYSEIECKIIDNAGCFENTPEKSEYGDVPQSTILFILKLVAFINVFFIK